MSRKVLFVIHAAHPTAFDIARSAASGLIAIGIAVAVSDGDESGVGIAEVTASNDAAGCELVMVFGGDGTILRGIEIAREHDVPVFSVNLGHVGFLAELEPEDLDETIGRVLAKDYTVEHRMTLDVRVELGGKTVFETWALNEASVEKMSRERMIEVVIGVDDRPISTFGCDGVLMATPTGSTAYSFSAGGPVVWPTVDALIMVPLSAHALFSRPLVTAPSSTLTVDVLPRNGASGVLWCDGRRTHALAPGSRIIARRSETPVRLAHTHSGPFSERLVKKFSLPTEGWRGSSA